MASIFKQQYTTKNAEGKKAKKKSQCWYVDYKAADGTRKRIKGFKDKAATIQLAAKLEREVALKILPEDLASDPERLGRFEREAKAIAALDHPNIVTVHSVEEAEGVHFITMGLVRGKSLSELIPRNGLPLGKFFDQAVALADAISAAHQQGITHRDLADVLGDGRRARRLT